ncbi:hypothetical protein [Microbulbifer sp. VAAF005]|uniref:hypothetical protein n=1 Tax=Microbulbifer sp. VAAF005 TaxID=3034230 RepID=UPI0024ADCD0C|nr:hypothetical protein [Microbulbifer sp. VAAF005]WHI47876.1 hypothetical protein P0078_05650 [Microbulbifer sp. VAAF005]
MQKLAGSFALDIAVYAAMSNNYHIVLYIDSNTSKTWPDTEVIHLWRELFNTPILAQHYVQRYTLNHGEMEKLKELIALWRESLIDISWFMRCLNESVARQANAKDNCTGRF